MSNIIDYNVFVDGACSLKHNRAGIGVYSSDLNLNVSLCIDNLFNKKTNSIAELYAVKHALDLISDMKNTNPLQFANITILSDSLYVVNTFTKWIREWEKKEWLCTNKKPVSHKELIIDIDTMLRFLKVSIKWIPREQNTYADLLSKRSIY